MRETVVRAVKVACVVTPVLTLLNHSREIAAAQLGAAFWLQVVLTFLVPYCVSMYSSAMSAIAEHRQMDGDPLAESAPGAEPRRA